jgi:hypothetical protein
MYSRRYVILLLSLLLVATAAAHGWSLRDGWFLDDHWHRRQYMSDQWSLRFLIDATTIKPDRFVDMWWQEKPIEWQYLRPVSILVAKVVYHLSGGSVKALHGFSILLHLLNALLVHHLCLRLTRQRFWSIVAALLFVVYSHSVYAVGWLAAQNTLLQTGLTLAALLCYARASGLNLFAAPTATSEGQTTAVPPLKWAWFGLALVLWCLALGSRENAVVFPVLTAAFDLAFGGRRHLKARWVPTLTMGSMAAAFVVCRLAVCTVPMPDFYFRRPDGVAYIGWWMVKLIHYLTATVWLSPMTVGPTGRFNPLIEAPGDCLLMVAILAIMGIGYYQACRQARGWWIWPLWMLLALLPVVPVMSTPHSGYMPGVAFSVAMVLGPGLWDRLRPVGLGRLCRPVAIWFLIATCIYVPIYRWMWNSVLAAERWTVAEIAASSKPGEASDLFLINLPFVNIYAQYELPEKWAKGSDAVLRTLPEARCHVLTYADNVLRMESPCRVEQIDAYQFSVAAEGRGYFSGALGRFLVEGMRSSGRFQPGQVIRGGLCDEPFDVKIVRADEQGVQELIFRFHKPLATSRYLFYVTTADRGAARLHFWGPDGPPPVPPLAPRVPDQRALAEAEHLLEAGQPEAADVLFAGMLSADASLRQFAWEEFRGVAQPVAAGLAAPVQGQLAGSEPPVADLERVRTWWKRSVDKPILVQLWIDQNRFDWFKRTRNRLFKIRQYAGRVVRTDLYLTGPPYPGPR